MTRIGPRPLILAGTAAAAGGMFWFSRLTEHAGYPGQLLGPMLVTSSGLGLLFVPWPWSPCTTWPNSTQVSPPACSTPASRSAARSGWPRWGTIAWTTVADDLRNATVAVAVGRQPAASPAQLTVHALATGFSRGFLVAAGIALLALLIALATIRVGRQELTGARSAPQVEAATSQPATVRQEQDRVALAAAVRPCRHC